MNNKGSFTRRSAIRSMGLIGAATALGTALSPSDAGARSKKTTAFALVGDRWHNFDYIRTALTRTLVKEAGISIDFTPDTTLFSAKTLKDYKLLIVLCDGMVFPGGYLTPFVMYEPSKMKLVSDPPVPKMAEKHEMWITAEQGKVLKNFVEKGGSAWFFHNSSYVSGANEDFRDVEGALFTGHTPFRPYKMHIVNNDHPITRGVNDFIVTEEQHYLIYDKDPKDVLMMSINEEGLEYTGISGNQGAACESVWAYEYGKGRVCFMAPGHTIHSFWNPEYVKLQKNAVKWLLRES